MTPTEIAAKLRVFNEWRRGDEDIPQFDPRDIGEAIDAAVEMIDRLEAAERERDAAELMSLALRAKIAEMERQKPVGTAHAMPGASAFTMACFDVRDIPVGAKLYALPGVQPAPSVPSGLHPLETVRFWADAYTHPGDDNFRGHGMAAALLREYAELRAALAAAPEAKP